MEIKSFEMNGVTLMTVNGRMDTISAGGFVTEAKAVISGGAKKILVDLAELQYISSAGLRSILTVLKQCKAEGIPLFFCSPQSIVSEVFDISGFSSILSVYQSREEAIAAFA